MFYGYFRAFFTAKNKDDSAPSPSYRHSADFESASLSIMDNNESISNAASSEETAAADVDTEAKSDFLKSLAQKLEPLVPKRTVPLPSSSVAARTSREGVKQFVIVFMIIFVFE